MGTISRLKTWIAGDILTSANLNSEFNNILNVINGALDSANIDETSTYNWSSIHTFSADLKLYSSADLKIYSDSGVTQKFLVDGATGATTIASTLDVTGASTLSSTLAVTGATTMLSSLKAGLLSEGQCVNLGMSIAATTLSITGYDGTALSASNPGFVCIRDSTSGRLRLATFTANQTLTFGAASDTDGNLFGITDVNWASSMPMFIGVVTNGTNSYFTLSRVPVVVTGAAAANLAQKGDTDADSQGDVMIWATGLTLANWVNLPITQVGWFNATYATAGGAWTFTLDAKTGFNTNYESVQFAFVSGQNGATAGKFLSDNAGTAPTFSSNIYYYYIEKNGSCTVSIYLEGNTAIDGAGAVTTAVALPFISITGVTYEIGMGSVYVNFPASGLLGVAYISAGASIFGIEYYSGGWALVQNVNFSDGNRTIATEFSYKVF